MLAFSCAHIPHQLTQLSIFKLACIHNACRKQCCESKTPQYHHLDMVNLPNTGAMHHKNHSCDSVLCWKHRKAFMSNALYS